MHIIAIKTRLTGAIELNASNLTVCAGALHLISHDPPASAADVHRLGAGDQVKLRDHPIIGSRVNVGTTNAVSKPVLHPDGHRGSGIGDQRFGLVLRS